MLDASHSATTSKAAAESNIILIVQDMDNHPALQQRIQEVAATAVPLESAHSHDQGRNRDERCTVAVFGFPAELADTGRRPRIAAVIRVERRVYSRDIATGLLR